MSDDEVIVTLVGTGKNEGRRKQARVLYANIYSVVVKVLEPECARDHREVQLYRSTGQTASATKGQTGWRAAPKDVRTLVNLPNRRPSSGVYPAVESD